MIALHSNAELCGKQGRGIAYLNWRPMVLFQAERSEIEQATSPYGLDSAVGIATGYGLDDLGVWSSSPGRGRIFLLSTPSRLVLGSTHPPIQLVPGALYPGVRRSGREADHSPPISAEVKKSWVYTSTPPYVFMA
jgi:hypothetical protein